MDRTTKLAGGRGAGAIPRPLGTLLLGLLLGGAALAAGPPVDSPEAQLAQAKSNLANVLHNLDVLSREEAELERLQKQHEALQLRYQGAPAQGTDPKERERLLKDVAKSVGEIQAQRSSVGRQREGWEQKRGDYEAAVRHWEAAVGGTSQKKPLPRLKTKGEVKANP